MTTPVIEARSLVKKFGSFTALDGLDLTLEQGQVMGFLGPNGAGKSTAIRVLLGLLRSTSGSATVFGRDAWTDSVAIHRDLAYVPGDVTLWPGLTGGQCLDIMTAPYGGLEQGRRKELLDAFDLDPTKKARTYSKGNRQKVALVAAFGVSPKLLILDEPTSGLDPLMESVFQNSLRDAVSGGATVLLSSHILSEVENLADHVTIIKSGRVVTSGTLQELRTHTRTHVHATLAQHPGDMAAFDLHDTALTEADGSFDIRASVEPARLPAFLGHLQSHGLTSLTATPPSLDELFMDVYAGKEVSA